VFLIAYSERKVVVIKHHLVSVNVSVFGPYYTFCLNMLISLVSFR